MNYYFFPRIPLLRTTVTLSNFPPTETSSWKPRSVYVHATFSSGSEWRVFYIRELVSGEIISLGEKDLIEHGIQDNAVFFFMYPERLHGNLKELPINNFMESEPNWRGNIQLSSDTTAVSYQGEYPGYMMNSSNGKLLTFNPLIQSQSDVITQLIVVVLMQTAEIKEGRFFIMRQISGKIERESKISTNTCNLIDFKGLKNDFTDPLCLYCPDMVGIPIFLSHDPSYQFLSLEHSYPLQEIIVFGNNAERFSFLRGVKNFWINLLDKNVHN